MLVPRLSLLALLAGLSCTPAGYAAGLPDTGQYVCDDGTNTFGSCDSDATGESAIMPRQDGRFGVDPDYAKVCNSGELAGEGTCPANPVLGTGFFDWGCTHDNITGLTWEVKTDDNGLRDKDWGYSWYNSDPTTNGGYAGTADGGDSCYNSSRCDTEKFVADVNARGLCGYSDWRLPSIRELETLVKLTYQEPSAPGPNIDTYYFPNTYANYGMFYWSATPDSVPVPEPDPYQNIDEHLALGIAFASGYISYSLMSYSPSWQNVRLVRGSSF